MTFFRTHAVFFGAHVVDGTAMDPFQAKHHRSEAIQLISLSWQPFYSIFVQYLILSVKIHRCSNLPHSTQWFTTFRLLRSDGHLNCMQIHLYKISNHGSTISECLKFRMSHQPHGFWRKTAVIPPWESTSCHLVTIWIWHALWYIYTLLWKITISSR